MSLTARVRALERARHAEDNRKPDAEEMRAAALSGEGRPVTLALLAKMRAFSASLDPFRDAHKE